jgi:hypothetical protein
MCEVGPVGREAHKDAGEREREDERGNELRVSVTVARVRWARSFRSGASSQVCWKETRSKRLQLARTLHWSASAPVDAATWSKNASQNMVGIAVVGGREMVQVSWLCATVNAVVMVSWQYWWVGRSVMSKWPTFFDSAPWVGLEPPNRGGSPQGCIGSEQSSQAGL